MPPTELFVLGAGRSGTTVMQEAIAHLDGFVAIPRLAGRFPATTAMATLLSRLKIGPDAWIRPSSESMRIFDEAGLTQEFQTSLGRHVTPADASLLRLDNLHRRLRTVRSIGRADTVVVKNTAASSRVPLLASEFPDAVFLHVLRHPARVVMSLLKVDFWQGMILWWDGRSAQQYGEDERLSQEEVAARHWAHQVGLAAADLDAFAPDRHLAINYDHFVDAPDQALTELTKLDLRLPKPAGITSQLRHMDIRPSADQPSIPPTVQAAVIAHCSDVADSLGMAM